MALAFVLGNGVSRRLIDLELLRPMGKIYGCNALYREFTPDVLVSTDLPIATAIQESRYAIRNRFYTRRPTGNLGALRIPQEFFGFSSGPVAVGIAAQDGARSIYMLGFDLGPTESGGFNNIYADTEFYKRSTSRPTYAGNWVKQILSIVRDFPTTTFYRVTSPDSAQIPELQKLANLAHVDMSEFQNRINNKKDL